MNLKPRRSNSVSIDDESIYSVESASRWHVDTTKHMNIIVKDLMDMFPHMDLPARARIMIIPEWEDTSFLIDMMRDLGKAPYNNSIKTLIRKVYRICIAQIGMTEVLVDGFIDSLLHILGFDDYPYSLYPQYSYMAHIGPNNLAVNAKSDFSVLSGNDQIMLVVEDKTVTNATYANNWKENQVIGELFVAVHDYVTRSIGIEYLVSGYAVRVIGTRFTFYKATATLDYIRESARLGMSRDNEMVVQRHPPVEDNPGRLTAYDICNAKDRMRILECLCSIMNSK